MSAIIIPQHRIAFFSVPKTASTSIKLMLYRLLTGISWSCLPNNVHNFFPTFPVTESSFRGLEGYFKCAVVRDPRERVLSSYGNRVLYHQDIKIAQSASLRRRIGFAVRGLSSTPSAEDYFQNIEKYQKISYSIWHHTTTVKNFIGNDIGFFDRIYAMHNLETFVKDICTITKSDLFLPREQTEGQKISFEDLGLGARNSVLSYCSEDSKFLARFLN